MGDGDDGDACIGMFLFGLFVCLFVCVCVFVFCMYLYDYVCIMHVFA